MTPLSELRVGILIPTRGDRLILLENALRLIGRQTIKPYRVEVVGETPKSEACDITYRYRTGYQKMTDVDVILFWEDDDWYIEDYIETMLTEWDKAGRPDLFGSRYTLYYHLKLKRYFKMSHESRASAMNTLIRANIKDIDWGKDDCAYTDTWLWMGANPLRNRSLFTPCKVIAIGMKHGIGKTGGRGHTDEFRRYVNEDEHCNFLRSVIDEESYQFYLKVHKQLSDNGILD